MRRATTHAQRLRRARGPSGRHTSYNRWRSLQPEVVSRAAFYRSRTWKAMRSRHVKLEPLCRRCRELGAVTPAEVVDHIIPIRERPDLAAEPKNLQSLCHSHHNEKSARERGGVA